MLKTRNGLYGNSTYRGRKGKNTHQLLRRIQTTNEYCRLGQNPAALVDVDAKNCFDCTTHVGIWFFQRRQGSQKDLVQCQCTNLNNTKHYSKRGSGVAKEPITALSGQSPEGSGQGAPGSSLDNWQGPSDPMIKNFSETLPATTLHVISTRWNRSIEAMDAQFH